MVWCAALLDISPLPPCLSNIAHPASQPTRPRKPIIPSTHQTQQTHKTHQTQQDAHQTNLVSRCARGQSLDGGQQPDAAVSGRVLVPDLDRPWRDLLKQEMLTALTSYCRLDTILRTLPKLSLPKITNCLVAI